MSDDLEWLYRPEVRAGAVAKAEDWQAMYEAAQATFPSYEIGYASAGEEPYLASRFSATDPSGASRIIYVDPSTGQVTGEGSWHTLPAFLRALHSYLFVPGDAGFYLVTSLGFLLLGSLISGLIVYKKFWRGFLKSPRTNRGTRVLLGDIHRLVALWSTWFVMIMAVTSIWYFAERILYRTGSDFEPSRTTFSVNGSHPSKGPHVKLERAIATARAALPNLTVREIWFPSRPGESLFVRGQTDASLVRDRTNGVEINPYTGRVLAIHDARRMSLGERWTHTADPLHFGDFGGLVSKIFWLLSGLCLCAIAASGAAINARRLASPQTRARSGRMRNILNFLGRWRWVNLVLIGPMPVIAYVLHWS